MDKIKQMNLNLYIVDSITTRKELFQVMYKKKVISIFLVKYIPSTKKELEKQTIFSTHIFGGRVSTVMLR